MENKSDLFVGIQKRTKGFVATAAVLLMFAVTTLILTVVAMRDQLSVLGQAVFMLLVFASATVILLTVIAQDIQISEPKRDQS